MAGGLQGTSQGHPVWYHPHWPLSVAEVEFLPLRPHSLGTASSLLLLADSLGLGACWPSRSRAHWGRKEGPAANQEQLPEFPRKGGNMPADSNFLTVTSPIHAPQSKQSGAQRQVVPPSMPQELGITILMLLGPSAPMPRAPWLVLSMSSSWLFPLFHSMAQAPPLPPHIHSNRTPRSPAASSS